MEICAVYKITNTVTGDFYIGSSKNVKRRWASHKCPYTWKKCPNKQLYKDMQKYGLDKFEFQVIEEVEIDSLKEKEQQFIETLKPTYNQMNAKGLDIERHKEYRKSDKCKKSKKKYQQSNKGKETQKKYRKSDKYKEYRKSDKCKESHRKSCKKYDNQLCFYNGETLTLKALSSRFAYHGIDHPTSEAKKYLIKNISQSFSSGL